MKAILVIDEMPTRCLGCPCYYEDKGRCQNTWESVEDDLARPSWCPLKPMPERKEEIRGIIRRIRDSRFESGYYEEMTGMYKDEHAKGWDACIDEILGEE